MTSNLNLNPGYSVGTRVANRYAHNDLGTVTDVSETGIRVAWDTDAGLSSIPMTGVWAFGDRGIPLIVNMASMDPVTPVTTGKNTG